MFPTLRRIPAVLENQGVSVLHERLDDIEENTQDLANYCYLLRHRLQKTQEKTQFLTQWMNALIDCHIETYRTLKYFEKTLDDQRLAIIDLQLQFSKLSLED